MLQLNKIFWVAEVLGFNYLGAFTGTEHTFSAKSPQRPTHKFQQFLVILGADATKDEMEFRQPPEPTK